MRIQLSGEAGASSFAPISMPLIMEIRAVTPRDSKNSRLRAAEIVVRGDEHFLIRKRETYADLTRLEQLPDFLGKD